jgi:hypothetical protein
MVVAAGALCPAMIMRATIDLVSGDLGFHVFSEVHTS